MSDTPPAMTFEERTVDPAQVPEEIAQAQRRALRLTARAVIRAAILNLLDSPEHAGDRETMEAMLHALRGEGLDSCAPPMYQCPRPVHAK